MEMKVASLIISMVLAVIGIGTMSAVSRFILDWMNEKVIMYRQAKKERLRRARIQKGREELWLAYIRLLLD